MDEKELKNLITKEFIDALKYAKVNEIAAFIQKVPGSGIPIITDPSQFVRAILSESARINVDVLTKVLKKINNH